MTVSLGAFRSLDLMLFSVGHAQWLRYSLCPASKQNDVPASFTLVFRPLLSRIHLCADVSLQS